MSRPASTGFVAELADIGFDWAHRAMVIRTVLPLGDFDGFARFVGTPPAIDPDADPLAPHPEAPAVMLLGYRRPRHPERDADVMAEAALGVLAELVAGGQLRINPEFSRRLGVIADAVSIRAVREAVSEQITEPA